MQTTLATKNPHALYEAQMRVASPLGPVLLARTSLGLAGLWFEGQKDCPDLSHVASPSGDALLKQVRQQLQDYWDAGATQSPRFEVPLDLIGTPFQRSVWQALLDIPYGSTTGYGDIARRVSSPQSSRAVGAAVGRNPISIIVPCHRVVGSHTQLTGYSGGMHRKVALLQQEGHAIHGDRVTPLIKKQTALL